MDERIQEVREALRSLELGDEWEAAIEGDFPAHLAAAQWESLEAYRRADVEWLLEHADEGIEIVQPPEFPDPRTYHGREGLLDCLLDWPRQWEDFQLEPRRIFAVDDEHVVTVAVHRGRARDIEVEAEIVWLTAWRDATLTRWEMFMNVDDAVAAASSGRASSGPSSGGRASTGPA
jgi:ketosteroid isomerase-like protein